MSGRILRGPADRLRFHWSVIGLPLLSQRARRSGTIPNVLRPKTFSEKTLHRILHDRRSIIARFSGKLESRDYVLARLGDPSILVELVGTARNAEELRTLPLPEKFIAKSNHMSGRNVICRDLAALDLDALGSRISQWCREESRLQWGYSQVRKVALIERLLETADGVPKDYKFYCYDGKVHFIQVDGNRFSGHKRDLFRPDWTHLDARFTYPNDVRPPPRPRTLRRMIEVAECLSSGVDFVRVDLYEVGDVVKFGELTCYPEGGMGLFSPESWDEVLGRPWKVAAGASRRPAAWP